MYDQSGRTFPDGQWAGGVLSVFRSEVPVGFISAIHGKFCDTCNRVRLTAEGYLKLCLCYDEGEDLRRVLREGEKENLRTIMEQTIFRKPAAHCFEHPAEMTETHEMVKIGG